MNLDQSSLSQAVRFGIVGLASNLILYILYLAMTSIGVGHKGAMTLLFALGVLQTFAFNKSWTFGHQGLVRVSLLKYVIIYGLAYFLNLTALLVLVDNFCYPHQIVQGVMIFSLALMLFLLQKFWVFRWSATVPTRE